MLDGDGVGPELGRHARALLKRLSGLGLDVELREAEIGGAAIDSQGEALPDATLEAVGAASAVFLGAVGGPKWDQMDMAQRPEKALLRLRQQMGVFANLRPLLMNPAMAAASPLRSVESFDVLIVRELTGGIYFGEPRGEARDERGLYAFNTMVYSEAEVDRIARVAFRMARARRRRLCSVDKANVLEVSRLWRRTVNRCAREYPDVRVEHLYIDNAAMQLILDPGQFDVMVTSNLFGDILSDLGAAAVGAIGALPSASLSESGPGLFEPVHGSAPDLAGKDSVNPLAMIYSLALLLEIGLGEAALARSLVSAAGGVLDDGLRTQDIHTAGNKLVSTSEMVEAVGARLSG